MRSQSVSQRVSQSVISSEGNRWKSPPRRRRRKAFGRTAAFPQEAAATAAVMAATVGIAKSSKSAMDTYYAAKIEELEVEVREKMLNLRRLEAQRNELNSKVRLLREELSLLQEPGSYVGEIVKVMGRKKVLVKVRPQPRGW